MDHPNPDLCSFWRTTAPVTIDEARSNACGKLAVVRRGIRCLNGCMGEGAFDQACPEHREYLEEPLSMYESVVCLYCGGPVEQFPAQPI